MKILLISIYLFSFFCIKVIKDIKASLYLWESNYQINKKKIKLLHQNDSKTLNIVRKNSSK